MISLYRSQYILFLFLLIANFPLPARSDASDQIQPKEVPRPQEVLKVAIYNEANFHGEVWPAFAYTFMQKGHDVEVFCMDRSLRMQPVLSSWLPARRVQHPSKVLKKLCQYEVFVFVTLQHTYKTKYTAESQRKNLRFNADQVIDLVQEHCSAAHFDKLKVYGVIHDFEYEKRVLDSTRVPNFLTISPHMTNMAKTLQKQGKFGKKGKKGSEKSEKSEDEEEEEEDSGAESEIRTFVPIFPLNKQKMAKSKSRYYERDLSIKGRVEYKGIIVQGIVSSKKRDYSWIIAESQRSNSNLNSNSNSNSNSDSKGFKSRFKSNQHENNAKSQRFNLTISGSNAKEAPTLLQQQQLDHSVKLLQPQKYIDFYGEIMQNIALYPAFSTNNETISIRASSTIPCSFISNTPLLGTRTILDAYSYLDEEAVWMEPERMSTSTSNPNPNPTPFDGIENIKESELAAKLQALDINRAKIHASNAAILDTMLVSFNKLSLIRTTKEWDRSTVPRIAPDMPGP